MGVVGWHIVMIINAKDYNHLRSSDSFARLPTFFFKPNLRVYTASNSTQPLLNKEFLDSQRSGTTHYHLCST